MNANTIISEEMSLDEKLAAIDAAMANAMAVAQEKTNTKGFSVQTDPADLTMCLGCQQRYKCTAWEVVHFLCKNKNERQKGECGHDQFL